MRVFCDTNVLIAASMAAHARQSRSREDSSRRRHGLHLRTFAGGNLLRALADADSPKAEAARCAGHPRTECHPALHSCQSSPLTLAKAICCLMTFVASATLQTRAIPWR